MANNDKSSTQTAKETADQTKNTLLKRLEDDGVVNPAGFALAGASALFLATIPVTSWVAQRNGLLERAVNALCNSIAYLGSAGSTSTVSQTGKIAALSALYLTVTYAFTGAGSAAGMNAGYKEGRDNNHPRAQIAGLQGLPLRLYSAHYHLMEKLPGFVLSAALAQAMAPGDQVLVNLLGLHVITKVFVHYPCYIFNVGVPRTLAHVVATASVINVALRLSRTP